MIGSLGLLAVALVIFIIANLAVGYTFSTIAQNQLQAMQMTMFFFLPSILLSGFVFPFHGHAGLGAVDRGSPAGHPFPADRPGHPAQGQWLCRKSGPICGRSFLFMFGAAGVALARFRRTLD